MELPTRACPGGRAGIRWFLVALRRLDSGTMTGSTWAKFRVV
jgi:hypothetical protein